MDFIILEGNMVLVGGVPLLDTDFIGSSSSLSCHQLLQVADRVILVALHSDLLPQPIVQHHLDHLLFLVSGSLQTLTLKLSSAQDDRDSEPCWSSHPFI